MLTSQLVEHLIRNLIITLAYLCVLMEIQCNSLFVHHSPHLINMSLSPVNYFPNPTPGEDGWGMCIKRNNNQAVTFLKATSQCLLFILKLNLKNKL